MGINGGNMADKTYSFAIEPIPMSGQEYINAGLKVFHFCIA